MARWKKDLSADRACVGVHGWVLSKVRWVPVAEAVRVATYMVCESG
jgi:hypothetical protein